jgi:copper oxidase (laccase) domain-containing protein
MTEEFGCVPADIRAALAPSIGPCCYEVGPDVIERVQASFPYWRDLLKSHPARDKAFFDLWRANHTQLVECGLNPKRIEVAEVCTKCRNDSFFSDRAQRPCGRFAAGIALLEH